MIDRPALPANLTTITIGAVIQSADDIQRLARAEINRLADTAEAENDRRARIAEKWAQLAGSASGANALRDRVQQARAVTPLPYSDYLEALRNFNAWSVRRDRALPNDSEALRQFLAKRLDRDRYTADPEGWRNYLADLGVHFPLPAAIPVALPEQVRRYHTLVAGSTGAGKSELLKALAYHYVAHSSAAVVVLDPHGDLVRQIAHWSEFQAAGGSRLIFIAYDGERQRCPVLNPFDVKGLPPHKRDEYVESFARVLGDTTPQGFTPAMANLIRYCSEVLSTHQPKSSPATLLDMHRFVSPYPEDAADLVEAARRHPDPLVANYFKADFNAPINRPTKEGLRARLASLLQYKAFRHMTCGRSTVDLSTAADKGAVILFDLASMGRAAGDTFGKLIVAQLVAHAMRRPESAESTETPIHLFIDEAERLFTGTFLTLLQETRKKALYLTFAQQVAGKGFSGQDLESLMINTNIKMQGPGGCPPRMLEQLNISLAEYRQHFPEVELTHQITGGDFLCKWGARAKTIFFKVTREVAGNRVAPAQLAALLEHQHLKFYERTSAGAFIEGAEISPADDPDIEEIAWPLK